MAEKMPVESYIWDTSTPNHALRTLKPPSPLCSIAFNNKNSEILCGGSYNGLINIWDLREDKPLIWST